MPGTMRGPRAWNNSSGNAQRRDGDFRVNPLPPAGPVTFVASRPEYGVAETRAEM
jgi:hypothetical protein